MLAFKDLNWENAEDIFRKVDQACSEVDVQFYLIGAQAINFNFLQSNLPPVRATKDFDFAVLVPNLDAYEKLQAILIGKGFKKGYFETWEDFKRVFSLIFRQLE